MRKHYGKKDLDFFKKVILEKKDEAQKQLDYLRGNLRNDANNGTNDTTFVLKSSDACAEDLEKEANINLAIRQEKFIRDLNNALQRIENKTYGVCRKTGELIPKERLLLVPHATLIVSAKAQK